jgi:PAS domain S-box-containing protein
LRDDDGNIIGTIGTSIDITDKKEKERLAIENERLKFENESFKIRAEEREKFRKDASMIFESIEKIADILPAPMYWLDTKGVVLGLNDITLKMVGGASSRESIIGNGEHSFYPKDVADTLIENNKKVLELGQTIEFEEKIVNIDTKTTQYLTSIRAPLRDYDGNIIGIIGTSIDITDKKEKEQLRIENAKYQAKEKTQQKFKKVMDVIQHAIQSYKIDTLNERIGVSLQYNELDKIKVTKREREILYFLALNKSPKEIAFILSTLENKNISYGTIGAFINKQLYPKFGVFNTSQLIEKATILNLIPSILDHDND